ncbi:dynactin subunit 3-like [Styela clava]
MATLTLEKLEERLVALEESICPDDNKILIDSLSSLNEALNNLASKRERVNLVFKRVPEIQEYLEPGFVESEELDVSAQRDYIILIEDEIKNITEQLQQVKQLSAVLNSEHICDYRKHLPKANQLQLKQIEQMEETENLGSDIAGLLNRYNDLTRQLSEYFVQVNNIVTSLEEQKIKEERDR